MLLKLKIKILISGKETRFIVQGNNEFCKGIKLNICAKLTISLCFFGKEKLNLHLIIIIFFSV